jgi:hypothetical protein
MIKLLVAIFFVLIISCGGGGGGNNDNNNNHIVTLTWEADLSNAGISGYKLYVGQESHKYDSIIDCGNVGEKTIELEKNKVYYISVTSYYNNIIDKTVEESDYSDELIYSTK